MAAGDQWALPILLLPLDMRHGSFIEAGAALGHRWWPRRQRRRHLLSLLPRFTTRVLLLLLLLLLLMTMMMHR
ncbi:unnamed protein product [Gongylonema pulchrum]|uniref:Secreted protein n=1 Tax=Gongylonema pulchrum TaxID=637853 RepID=A0A183DR95_9BILA|nr:unnamed protein product [Gongylonema pulchrum]